MKCLGLSVSFGLFIIITMALYPTVVYWATPTDTVGAGFTDGLGDFQYRTEHNITGSAVGAQTDYPMNITVVRGTGTNTDEMIFVNKTCQADFDDLRFTDTSNVEHDYARSPKEPVDLTNEITLWLTEPRAVRYNDTYDRTYITWMDYDYQHTQVVFYDHDGDYFSEIMELGQGVGADYHCAPTLNIDNNGYIHLFWGGDEKGAEEMFYQKSTNPEDIYNWDNSTRVAVSDTTAYSKPLIQANGTIYLFYRHEQAADHYQWKYIYSLNGGTTWQATTLLINFGLNTRPYMTGFVDSSDRIHVAWSFNYDLNSSWANMFYGYSDNGLEWHKVDGTQVVLPFAEANSGKVRQTTDIMVHSVKAFTTNRPGIVYEESQNTRISTWSGAAWVHTTIAPTNAVINVWHGSNLHMTTASDFIVYLAQVVAGIFEIQLWESADTGATWAKTADCTTGSSEHHAYPYIPLNYQNDFACWFLEGGTAAIDTFTTGQTPQSYSVTYSGTSDIISDIAHFWVEIPTIPIAPNYVTIRVYWGDATATSESDPTATFDFYDDFNDNSINASKWAETDGNITEANGRLYIHQAAGARGKVDSLQNLTINKEARFYIACDNTAGHYLMKDYPSTAWLDIQRQAAGSTFEANTMDASVSTTTQMEGVDSFYSEFWMSWTANLAWYTQNRTLQAVHTTNVPTVADTLHMAFWSPNINCAHTYLEWVFVREWVNPEPTHEGWGSLEESYSETYAGDWDPMAVQLSELIPMFYIIGIIASAAVWIQTIRSCNEGGD